jgi:hypothetical protein
LESYIWMSCWQEPTKADAICNISPHAKFYANGLLAPLCQPPNCMTAFVSCLRLLIQYISIQFIHRQTYEAKCRCDQRDTHWRWRYYIRLPIQKSCVCHTCYLIDYDGVRLCLRTAATNGPIHPLGVMWAWRAMVLIMPAGYNSWLVQQRYVGQVGGMDEGVRIFPISIWNTSKDF